MKPHIKKKKKPGGLPSFRQLPFRDCADGEGVVQVRPVPCQVAEGTGRV